jgi:hypothetical protein
VAVEVHLVGPYGSRAAVAVVDVDGLPQPVARVELERQRGVLGVRQAGRVHVPGDVPLVGAELGQAHRHLAGRRGPVGLDRHDVALERAGLDHGHVHADSQRGLVGAGRDPRVLGLLPEREVGVVGVGGLLEHDAQRRRGGDPGARLEAVEGDADAADLVGAVGQLEREHGLEGAPEALGQRGHGGVGVDVQVDAEHVDVVAVVVGEPEVLVEQPLDAEVVVGLAGLVAQVQPEGQLGAGGARHLGGVEEVDPLVLAQARRAQRALEQRAAGDRVDGAATRHRDPGRGQALEAEEVVAAQQRRGQAVAQLLELTGLLRVAVGRFLRRRAHEVEPIGPGRRQSPGAHQLHRHRRGHEDRHRHPRGDPSSHHQALLPPRGRTAPRPPPATVTTCRSRGYCENHRVFALP